MPSKRSSHQAIPGWPCRASRDPGPNNVWAATGVALPGEASPDVPRAERDTGRRPAAKNLKLTWNTALNLVTYRANPHSSQEAGNHLLAFALATIAATVS